MASGRPLRTLLLNAYVLFGARRENLNEDRVILSAAKCKVYADVRGGSLERKRQTTAMSFSPTTTRVRHLRRAGLTGVGFDNYCDG